MEKDSQIGTNQTFSRSDTGKHTVKDKYKNGAAFIHVYIIHTHARICALNQGFSSAPWLLRFLCRRFLRCLESLWWWWCLSFLLRRSFFSFRRFFRSAPESCSTAASSIRLFRSGVGASRSVLVTGTQTIEPLELATLLSSDDDDTLRQRALLLSSLLVFGMVVASSFETCREHKMQLWSYSSFQKRYKMKRPISQLRGYLRSSANL